MGTTIKVCMGSSCFARGNAKNLQLIQKYIDDNNLDGEIELTGLRCCDKCAKGPNITIDQEEYNNIDQGTLLDILDKHFKHKE
ncbi:MAG: (2Fe-2S) ferredoxin domain-containing protein [Alphaproteobacteria bacterium]|nr:(2Fe-2S) ferredoxin domain-containing protein [Alphaproteobacteria bacterium]